MTAVCEPPLTLARLNGLSMLGFIDALFPLYERAPWVLPLAYAQRPFLSLDHLHRVLTEIVASADPGARQAILAEHPDFLTHAQAAPAPEREAAANLGEAARGRLRKAQADYQKKFGFPLVISFATAQAAGEDIAARSAARLANPLDRELTDAAEELARVVRYRLDELVGG